MRRARGTVAPAQDDEETKDDAAPKVMVYGPGSRQGKEVKKNAKQSVLGASAETQLQLQAEHRADVRNQVVDQFMSAFQDKPDPDKQFAEQTHRKQNILTFCCVEIGKQWGCVFVPLHEAVIEGDPKILRKTIIKLTARRHFVAVNKLDNRGRTPLSLAIKERREDLVEQLLEFGANVRLPDKETGLYPLHLAAMVEMPGILRKLITKTPPINPTDPQGMTPLMVAAITGNEEITDMLLFKGGDVDMVDHNGWTALHYACYGGHIGAADLLLEQGAEKEARDRKNLTPKDWATEYEHGELVSFLESYEASMV